LAVDLFHTSLAIVTEEKDYKLFSFLLSKLPSYKFDIKLVTLQDYYSI
jgi:hypothetical protein